MLFQHIFNVKKSSFYFLSKSSKFIVYFTFATHPDLDTKFSSEVLPLV